MKVLKKIFNILGVVLLIVLLAVVIVMFNARISGEAPNVFGYQIFRVSSGSMEPELMVGDVILVKSVEPDEIHKGDTVTYKGEEGDFRDKFITHKVIEEPVQENGVYVFQTQGIYVGALPDPLWDEEQLIGKFVCKIPYINEVYNFFLKPYGLVTFILIIIVLFGYEMIALILSYKTLDEIEEEDRRESRNKQLEENNSSDDN